MKTDVKQHDITDCGAACICSVARHFGIDVPITIIRQTSGTNELGTSIKGVIDAFASIGFEAKGYTSAGRDIEALKKVPAPVILHIVTNNGDLHFVVLYKCGKRKAIIMDPAEGRHIKIKYEKLRKIWSGHIITADKSISSTPDPGSLNSSFISHSLIFRYIRIIACFAKRDLLSSLPGSFFSVLTGIGIALYIQRIIDFVLPSGDFHLLLQTAVQMIAMVLLSSAITFISSLFTLRAGVKIDSGLILEYLRHLFSLPAGFFSSRSTGELNSRISDAMKIRRLLTEGIPEVLNGTLLLAGALVLMFTVHRKLAVIALLFIPIYLVLCIIILKVNRKMNRKVVESAAQFERRSVESISAIRTLKYFGCQAPSAKAEREFCRFSWNLYSNSRAAALFGTWAELLGKLLGCSIIAAGGIFILHDTLTIGELVSFYTLTAWFSAPLAGIARLGVELNEANLSLERLDDILLMKSEQENGLEYGEEHPAEDIIFKNVDFSYPGTPPVLTDFNLRIPAGKITAITGESGCGKSSLAALLMRDWDVNRGSILLGMNNISLFSISWWRNYVSIVPQEARLTGDSILDNITGGERNPDIGKAASILTDLGMKEFITSLPLGLLTPTGEGGSLLSGGQRQRVAMARALWKEPKILILDEATSSLDYESQKYILDKAVELRNNGITIIMITHRRQNTEIADYIFEMTRNLTGQSDGRRTP